MRVQRYNLKNRTDYALHGVFEVGAFNASLLNHKFLVAMRVKEEQIYMRARILCFGVSVCVCVLMR